MKENDDNEKQNTEHRGLRDEEWLPRSGSGGVYHEGSGGSTPKGLGGVSWEGSGSTDVSGNDSEGVRVDMPTIILGTDDEVSHLIMCLYSRNESSSDIFIYPNPYLLSSNSYPSPPLQQVDEGTHTGEAVRRASVQSKEDAEIEVITCICVLVYIFVYTSTYTYLLTCIYLYTYEYMYI
jgi:hypothetical protein